MRKSLISTALKMAKLLANCRSEDPNTKVGACGIRKDKSFIFGYNGAPPGVEIDWSNREEKNKRVIHAEMNVLAYTTPGEIDTIVCTHSPCYGCLPVLARYGIKNIYYEIDFHSGPDSKRIAEEFGVVLTQIQDND